MQAHPDFKLWEMTLMTTQMLGDGFQSQDFQ